jgi:hypothetical protein
VRRIAAAGTYTLPEKDDSGEWRVSEVTIEIQAGSSTTWKKYSATVDKDKKSWSYLDSASRAVGTYQVRGQLKTYKTPSFTDYYYTDLKQKSVTIE